MSAVLEQTDTPQSLKVELAVNGEFLSKIRPTGAVAVAQAYEIDSAEMAQLAADERKHWAARIDNIKAMRRDFVEPAQTILERAKKWFTPPIEDLEAGRELLGAKLLAWDKKEKERVAREQAERDASARKIRQEAEAKAAAELAKAQEVARQKEAQAKAESEARARAEAAARQAAEERRIAEEAGNKAAAQAAAEAERKANAEAKAAAAAEAKAAGQAAAAVANGAATAARVQIEAAAIASAQPLVTEAAKIAGQSTKANWVAVLADGETEQTALLKIVTAIVNDKREDLLAILSVDTAPKGPLNRLAAAQQVHMRVPGFRAENQPVIAGRRK